MCSVFVFCFRASKFNHLPCEMHGNGPYLKGTLSSAAKPTVCSKMKNMNCFCLSFIIAAFSILIQSLYIVNCLEWIAYGVFGWEIHVYISGQAYFINTWYCSWLFVCFVRMPFHAQLDHIASTRHFSQVSFPFTPLWPAQDWVIASCSKVSAWGGTSTLCILLCSMKNQPPGGIRVPVCSNSNSSTG